MPRRLLEDPVLTANSPRQTTNHGILVVRLKNTDPAHLDGLRLMMDALKGDPFGWSLNGSPRDVAIRPAMTILINNGLSEQTRYLLRHYGLLDHQSAYTMLDDVLSLRCTYSELSRGLLGARPEDEQLRMGISQNGFPGDDLVRWIVDLGDECVCEVALRPRGSDLGRKRETWIAAGRSLRTLHRNVIVLEQDESTRKFWLYVLLHKEKSTRNFYVGSDPPCWSHTRVRNGDGLLTHMGMLLLAGRVWEGVTPSTSTYYNTIRIGTELDRDVIHKVSQTMPYEAYSAVFGYHTEKSDPLGLRLRESPQSRDYHSDQ